MKTIFTLLIIFLSSALVGQYLEDFNIANKGIFNPGCTGATLATCSNIDLTGVDWTMGGDLSGIDSEGFFTVGGALLTADADERACWISPTLYIDNVVGTASLSVSISIPSTSTDWDAAGNVDFMDVEYSIDGGSFTVIPNVHGCGANSHTISGFGCTPLSGPSTYTVNATGLSGTTLNIQVCMNSNISTEQGQINSVSVPEANVTTVLPVDLTDFSARIKGELVQLDWVTASEINNDFFSIERSQDGRTFETIGSINGFGNSTEEQVYQFIDENPPINSDVYYRLLQVDFDDEFAYSDIQHVKIEKPMKGIRIQPKLIDSETHIKLFASVNEDLQISIYNLSGQLVVQTTSLVAFDQAKRIDIRAVPPGSYFMQIRSRTINETHRFVKI